MAKLNPLGFVRSSEFRVSATELQSQRIQALYSEAAEIAKAAAERLDPSKNISSSIRQGYLKNLQQDLSTKVLDIGAELNKTVPGTMRDIAQAVVKDNLDWLGQTSLGGIKGAFHSVPDQVVRSLVTGKLYPSGFSLSGALWQDVRTKQGEIYDIVARGLALNKSAFDIAKDLETYVDPKSRKPWDWGKVYPGSAKKIDYNAQRLSRTLCTHAYQQAFVRTTQPNPFVSDYVWHSVFSARTCQVCKDLDGKHFAKDKLPFDHPNGMCYNEAYIPDSMDKVADRLADWARGGDDSALDKYAAVLKSGQGSDPGFTVFAQDVTP